MRQATHTFITDQSGAVTVDWVVITAGLVGLGLATVTVIATALDSQSTALSGQLHRKGISTSFFGDDAPTIRTLVSHADMEMSLGGQVTFISTGGSDDMPGYIELVDDAGYLDMLNLGANFQGDQSNLLGENITFDIGVFSGGNQQTHGASEPLLSITDGAGNLLTYTTAQTPDGTPGAWTSFDIPITADAPGWTLNGDPVTQAQMQAVLSDVDSFEVRGEHFNGDETIGLDNMYLTHTAQGLDFS